MLDLDLQKLSWNEWEFIQDNYGSGTALSTGTLPVIERQQHQLKALVICGQYNDASNPIDLQPDLDAIRKYLGDVVDLEVWECNYTTSKLELLKKLDESTLSGAENSKEAESIRKPLLSQTQGG